MTCFTWRYTVVGTEADIAACGSVDQLVATISGYLLELNPHVELVAPIPEHSRRDGHMVQIVLTGTIDAPDLTSAEHRVEQRSFHGASHGWDVGADYVQRDITHPDDRIPYVGDGADGCLRSAAIDRSEADCYDHSDPRASERAASAIRWEEQAQRSNREPT